MTLEETLVNELLSRHITITAAESLTAGEFQSTLGNVPGVSEVFEGGFVTYSNQVKEQLLHIPHEVIEENGVVSEQTAIWMANQARSIMDKDWECHLRALPGQTPLKGIQPEPCGLALLMGRSTHTPRNSNSKANATTSELRRFRPDCRWLWI